MTSSVTCSAAATNGSRAGVACGGCSGTDFADATSWRYGGEQFVLVLPNTSAGAAAVAERFRRRIAALAAPAGNVVVRVTMSFGYVTSSAPHLMPATGLLRAADEALYAAKRGGRNRVAGSRGVEPPAAP
jgi:two-component system, cell cycle response regulator